MGTVHPIRGLHTANGGEHVDTERRFPRTTREAWREWPESALGIEQPPVAPPAPPAPVRALLHALRWWSARRGTR